MFRPSSRIVTNAYALHFDVVGFAFAVGTIRRWKIRDVQQKFAHLTSDLVGRGSDFALALAEGTALLLQRFGAGDIAVATQLPDLFRQPIDLRS